MWLSSVDRLSMRTDVLGCGGGGGGWGGGLTDIRASWRGRSLSGLNVGFCPGIGKLIAIELGVAGLWGRIPEQGVEIGLVKAGRRDQTWRQREWDSAVQMQTGSVVVSYTSHAADGVDAPHCRRSGGRWWAVVVVMVMVMVVLRRFIQAAALVALTAVIPAGPEGVDPCLFVH